MTKFNFSNLAASGMTLALTLALTLTITLGLGVCTAQAQDVDWQPNVEAAINKAKAEKKLVLLHFTASWCRPCQTLEKFVFRNLDVARSVNEHVVGVQLDVDREQSIVTEYGVTAVPFDIVITPGGRVIRRQKSPLDSNGYRRMMADLASPVKELEDKSNVAIAQQLNDFSKQFDFKPNKLSEFQSHTPAGPQHHGPSPSADSAQLARRNRVQNPFVAAKAKPIQLTAPKAEPSKISNAFVASPAIAATQAAAVQSPPSMARPSLKVSNDFTPASTATSETLPNQAADFQSATSEPAPKVGPPTLESTFEEITGAEQEAAFRMKPKHTPSLTPNVSPLLRLDPEEDSKLNKPQLPQMAATTKSNPSPSIDRNAFAAEATRKHAQQDRLFESPVKVGPVDQTRMVPPSQMAQRLLQPVKSLHRHLTKQKPEQPVAKAATAQQLLAPQIQQARQAPQKPTAKRVQKLLEPQPPVGDLASQPTATSSKPTGPQPGLHGMCPVTLLQEGQWVPGDAKFGCIHRDRLYIFATAKKMADFRAAPDRYSPVLAGYDPVVFHQTGKLVDGLAEHGVFMKKSGNQQVLLFTSAETRDQFQKNSAAYLNSVRQAMNAGGGTSRTMR